MCAGALARRLRRGRPTMIAESVRAARIVMREQRLAAAVIDLRLPDGSGFDALRTLRETSRRTPALILTGHLDEACTHTAFALGAFLLAKPPEAGELDAFTAHAVAFDTARDSRTCALAQRVARERELTAVETGILMLSLRNDLSRSGIAAEMRISDVMLVRHVNTLLRKFRANTLGDLARDLLRDALDEEPSSKT